MKRALRGIVLPLLVVVAVSSAGCERVCVLPKGNGSENGNGSAGGLCIPA